MNKKDSISTKMKQYEEVYDFKLLPNSFFVARLDGRGFSRYTKAMKFEKPFDKRLMKVMKRVTKELMIKNHASLGYTQSDEISLVFNPNRMFFNGRIQKICSTLAAQASVLFSIYLTEEFSDDKEKLQKSINLLPTFDCRVFSTPNENETMNAVYWREKDAIKNSINCLAQSLFSHKEIQGLNGKQLKEKMINEKNIFWEDLPLDCKRGTYFIKKAETLNFEEMSDEEINSFCERTINSGCKIPLEKLKENLKKEKIIFRKNIIEDESFYSIKEFDFIELEKILNM